MNKKTLVIGASENPQRYSYLAINSLLHHGHDVVAISGKPGTVNNIKFETEKKLFTDIDTVTLYINPMIQKTYYDYIISLHPKRIIFNPGTENKEFIAIAEAEGIEPKEACTLVLLSTGQF